MIDKSKLLPGDCLLYGRTPFRRSPLGWFFGIVINIKTASRFTHVEIYDGDGRSLASRDGKGVGRYPLRLEELAEVRRPTALDFSHELGSRWFQTVEGQKYDWKGLLVFTLAVKQGAADRMFCSEFATRFYRKSGLELFNPDDDADKIAPAQLHQTPKLATFWKE